ncbi:MAG: DUF3500 domain-containing protein [Bacteroidota bacterium]
MTTNCIFFSLIFTFLFQFTSYAQGTALEANIRAAKHVLKVFQKKDIQLDFRDLDRYRWSNLPVFLHERKGVALEDMNEEQKRATQLLLQAALSDMGYLKANWIIWLDERRKEEMKTEGSDVFQHYGQGKFWLTIFGKPSKDSDWGWRLEGHHLSINMTFSEGNIYITPLFLGAHPTVVADGPFAGFEAMYRETQLGNALFESLSEKQKATAVIAKKAYEDILTRTGREAYIKKGEGINVADLSARQQSLVKKIIETYFSNFRKDIATTYLRKIDIKEFKFVWAGTGKFEDGIYYRLQSPQFVIEYDHRNADIDHIHSVFYDLKGAFGELK